MTTTLKTDFFIFFELLILSPVSATVPWSNDCLFPTSLRWTFSTRLHDTTKRIHNIPLFSDTCDFISSFHLSSYMILFSSDSCTLYYCPIIPFIWSLFIPCHLTYLCNGYTFSPDFILPCDILNLLQLCVRKLMFYFHSWSNYKTLQGIRVFWIKHIHEALFFL